tara:strand:- start:11 stop:853 length:843 start_codon:yes stop_codon:yes gene_type:complete
MIIWIASYPKSGNTWLRAMLSAFFYSNDGNFSFELLDNIKEFPKHSEYLNKISAGKNLVEIAKEWIPAQTMLNSKLRTPTIFLKTHSAICSIDGSDFTDEKNTLAALYIVRDPRNVVSSLSNHFNLSIEKSLELIVDKNKIISNPTDKNKNIGLTVLSNWKTNYQSWRDWKSVKVKIIKYEDLIYSSKNTFINILNFLKEFIKIEFNENKIKNVIQSTEFKRLKSFEQKYGFKESAAMFDRTKSFFNLGPHNDWKKILDKKTSEKICEYFKDEMKELGYI